MVEQRCWLKALGRAMPLWPPQANPPKVRDCPIRAHCRRWLAAALRGWRLRRRRSEQVARRRSASHAPTKAEAWQRIASAADRAAASPTSPAPGRPGLADARKAISPRRCARRASCSDQRRRWRGRRRPRAATVAGWSSLGGDKAAAFEKFKPFFCYVEVEGESADHRQADRQPAPRRAAVGGR